MFVLVNTHSGRQTSKTYATERGAKGACTKYNKKYAYTVSGTTQGAEWVVMSLEAFKGAITMVERTNALTGEKFMESSDTPYHCSPSSESYWCN